MRFLLTISRILRIQKFINPFLNNYNLNYLKLLKREQAQIKYLINLIKPFCYTIKVVSSTKRTTINYVFLIYNKLLEYLKRVRRKLTYKNANQKIKLINGINKSQQKLLKYYSTIDSIKGYIYRYTILLNLAKKKSYWNITNQSGKPKYPKKYQ